MLKTLILAGAATALIAGLAEPSLRYFGSHAGDLVVVIDLSASMKARGKRGMRFDAARKEFLSLVDNLASGQKMLVIGAGAQPRLLMPFSADQRRLRELARELLAAVHSHRTAPETGCEGADVEAG